MATMELKGQATTFLHFYSSRKTFHRKRNKEMIRLGWEESKVIRLQSWSMIPGHKALEISFPVRNPSPVQLFDRFSLFLRMQSLVLAREAYQHFYTLIKQRAFTIIIYWHVEKEVFLSKIFFSFSYFKN